jgi:hypothetical protein
MIPGRIIICTPTIDGTVTGLHYASAWPLFASTEVGVLHSQLFTDTDLTRARSVAVRIFLEETAGSHLLFWDADVEASAPALRGMLAEGVDCIGATYPKKHLRPGEARPRDFAVYTEGKGVAHNGTSAEVSGIGLGFMLLSRHLLDLMVAHYDQDLHFFDHDRRTVALFQLEIGEDHQGRRRLWPEDYSFCRRVRGAGSSVRLYTGPGSPLAHAGMHEFRGRASDIHPEDT